jgi:hypothetical protein
LSLIVICHTFADPETIRGKSHVTYGQIGKYYLVIQENLLKHDLDCVKFGVPRKNLPTNQPTKQRYKLDTIMNIYFVKD